MAHRHIRPWSQCRICQLFRCDRIARVRGGSIAEKILDLLPVQSGGELFFIAEQALDEVAFAGLEVEDLFLDRSAGDEFVAGDDIPLADPVGAVGGLGFHGWIPPGIEMDNRVRPGEVEADAARLEADEENGDGRVALEMVDDLGAVARGAVEVAEGDVPGGEIVADEREHLGELTEDQDAVAAVEDFLEELVEEFDFAGGHGRGGVGVVGLGRGGFEVKQSRITADLAEPQEGGEHEHAVFGGRLVARARGVKEFAAAGFEDLLVDGALVLGEFAGADLLDFGGEIGGDVAFQATEQERLEAAREPVLDDATAVAGDG